MLLNQNFPGVDMMIAFPILFISTFIFVTWYFPLWIALLSAFEAKENLIGWSLSIVIRIGENKLVVKKISN